MTLAEDSVPATVAALARVRAFGQGMLVHRLSAVALLAVYEELTREHFRDLAGALYDAQVDLLQAGVEAGMTKVEPIHATERSDK